jgi:hypothetical protein
MIKRWYDASLGFTGAAALFLLMSVGIAISRNRRGPLAT